MADWRTALLQRLGAPATKQNLAFLDSWQRWEGGATNNDASYNWLNTTRDAPGAVRSINSVGVKAFDSFQHGVNALAQTLQSGRYGDLVSAFQGGNPYAANPVAGLSTWLSGSPTSSSGAKYAARVLGTRSTPQPAPRPAPVVSPPLAAAPAPQGAGSGTDANTLLLAYLARRGTNPLLLDILQQQMSAPAKQSHTRSLAKTANVPTNPGPVGPGLEGLLAYAVGGKYNNLGGPAEHHRRALGNWQSDNAYDLGVPTGTPIYAVSDGTVGPNLGVQGSRPKDGARLTLNGKNNEYWYGHLSKVLVKPGQRVKRGDLLGYSGTSQNGVPHLHLGFQHM